MPQDKSASKNEVSFRKSRREIRAELRRLIKNEGVPESLPERKAEVASAASAKNSHDSHASRRCA